MKKDIKVIIGLAFALSIGILLNILSCSIWNNWFPITVVVAYVLAPWPNIICGNCGRGYDENRERAFIAAGNFLTGMFVISGLALPAVLTHLEIMQVPALIMGLAGGVVTYGTILLYLHVFHTQEEYETM